MKLSLLKQNIIFKKLKDKIENAISEEILQMGEKTDLRDAVEYSLLNGGKRFRPIIVMLIAKALNNNLDVTKVALATEFFHTASLIADDLPCMDNEKERRCKPALHLKFNEAIAILASYSLISSGYELLHKNANELKKILPSEKCEKLAFLALETVSKYAGINGATSGQYLDLFTKDYSSESINEIILKKTISLFEIAFILGWLFGGGDINEMNLVKKVSYHFGMAFQIADDIKDYSEDMEKNKKINIAISIGETKAKELYYQNVKLFKNSLVELNIFSDSFKLIVDLFENETF